MATEVAAECAPFVVRYLAGDLCGFPALAIRAVEFGLFSIQKSDNCEVDRHGVRADKAKAHPL
jgi:hypothetical protein